MRFNSVGVWARRKVGAYLGGVEEELEEVAPAGGTGPHARRRRHFHRAPLIHGFHGGARRGRKAGAQGVGDEKHSSHDGGDQVASTKAGGPLLTAE